MRGVGEKERGRRDVPTIIAGIKNQSIFLSTLFSTSGSYSCACSPTSPIASSLLLSLFLLVFSASRAVVESGEAVVFSSSGDGDGAGGGMIGGDDARTQAEYQNNSLGRSKDRRSAVRTFAETLSKDLKITLITHARTSALGLGIYTGYPPQLATHPLTRSPTYQKNTRLGTSAPRQHQSHHARPAFPCAQFLLVGVDLVSTCMGRRKRGWEGR